MPILYMLGKGGISVLQTSIFLSITCHFSFICQNIFIWVIWSDREMCPLAMYPIIIIVF